MTKIMEAELKIVQYQEQLLSAIYMGMTVEEYDKLIHNLDNAYLELGKIEKHGN